MKKIRALALAIPKIDFRQDQCRLPKSLGMSMTEKPPAPAPAKSFSKWRRDSNHTSILQKTQWLTKSKQELLGFGPILAVKPFF
jgi:hypothetical protein